MIKLFMRDHSMVSIKNRKELDDINPEDIKFYKVPLSGTSYNEPVSLLLTNIKLLYEFDYATINASYGAVQYPSEDADSPYSIYELPRAIREFEDFDAFCDFISYLFSFKRMMLVNSGLYDATVLDDVYYGTMFALFDIKVEVKYRSKPSVITIINHRYVSDKEGSNLYSQGDIFAGLQYATITIDDYLGTMDAHKIKSNSQKNDVVYVLTKDRLSNDYELRPYTLYSDNFKYLTENDGVWKFKKYRDMNDDEQYYVDLFSSDACIRINKNTPKILENAIEYLTFQIEANINDGIVQFDIDQSYGRFSAYTFEKLAFVTSSLSYIKALISLINGKNYKSDVWAVVNIIFRDGDELTLSITEESKNVLQTIVALATHFRE